MKGTNCLQGQILTDKPSGTLCLTTAMKSRMNHNGLETSVRWSEIGKVATTRNERPRSTKVTTRKQGETLERRTGTHLSFTLLTFTYDNWRAQVAGVNPRLAMAGLVF